jgi:hypothetical protein
VGAQFFLELAVLVVDDHERTLFYFEDGNHGSGLQRGNWSS